MIINYTCPQLANKIEAVLKKSAKIKYIIL